jgi:hypothetical protein
LALKDILEDIIEDAEECEESVGTNPGPLSGAELATVSDGLEAIRENIDKALDDITGAGSADTSSLPATLPALAHSAVTLALAAYGEARRPQPNHTVIGNFLKTLDWQITTADGYEDRAGIE